MKPALIWIWNSLRIMLALFILFVAVVFAAVEVGVHWISERLERLANRIS